jgi:PAS domain S-box-containing protein
MRPGWIMDRRRRKSQSFSEIETEAVILRRESAQLKSRVAELERVLAEERQSGRYLGLSEEQLRLLFDNVDVEVALSDRDGTAIYINPMVEKQFGYKREELIGRNFAQFDLGVKPGAMEELVQFHKRAIEDSSYISLETEFKHKSGEIVPVHIRGGVLAGNGQVHGVISFIEDVTERRQWEERLARLYAEEKAARQGIETELNRRVEFARMVGDQLKMPLSSILSLSDYLAGELHDEGLLNVAKTINMGALTLKARIDQLIDLAKGEVGILEVETKRIDLLEILHDESGRVAPMVKSQGQLLRVELPPSLPLVQADPARIQQVVANLLDNALKFTPKGGRIKLRAYLRDNDVVVEVQDSGSGIAEIDQSRLFDPYQRLARDKGRMSRLGLGLPLSKKLVELHGGQIWVKSHSRGGVLFGFSLPMATPLERGVDSRMIGRLWKVLIIEDDQGIVDSVAIALQKHWPVAELVSARMGQQGIEHIEDGHFDAVILDLGLPDMDGLDVLRQTRFFSSVPILVLSVREDDSEIARALGWGADDYITIPFKSKELVARLQARVRQRTSHEEEVPLVCGALRLDPISFQLRHGTREVSLTTIEGRILQCLMKNAGRPVPHAYLAEEVWGEEYPGSVVCLRSYIRRLRGKLELDPNQPKLILTKVGIGYSLANWD